MEIQQIPELLEVAAMNPMKNRLNRFATSLMGDESGQDLIEYALMVAMIAVAIAATFPATIAPSVSSVFSRIQSSFAASNSAS